MGRCVVRCNVNNLLLAIIVIESIFLGWFFLGLLTSPSGFSGDQEPAADKGGKALVKTRNFVFDRPADEISASSLSTGFLVSTIVLFVIQFLALICLVLGYKNQNYRPLTLFLLWLVLSNLFYIVILILAAVNAHSYPDQFTTAYDTYVSKDEKAVDVSGTIAPEERGTKLEEIIPPKPLVLVLRNTIANFNCIIIPLLIIKFLLLIFEIGALVLAIRYFKKLQEDAEKDPELKEQQPMVEKS